MLSQNIKTFIFLGDYGGELAYPEKTMQILYELHDTYKCYFIKGNKEDYWLDYKKNGEVGWQYGNSATGSLLYTYSRLAEKDIEFFENLPISDQLTFPNMPPITICHGSPYKTNQKLLPDNQQTFDIMESMDTSLIICGHTHVQNKIEYKGKTVLNGGSVGGPLYSNGKSQFLILHGVAGEWKEEFISLTYDTESVIKELHLSGLNKHAPYWYIVTENLLRYGNIPHSTVLVKAMSLCKEDMGSCTWPDIPEKYWKRAVEEIFE